MIAGSSSLLAVESFGYSRGRVERGAAADVASDDAAYLGLIDRDGRESDGVETNGLLFETNPDSNRYPPAAFDLINQLPEPISVTLTLADDRFRFRPSDGAEIDGTRLVADDLTPGKALGTAIDLRPCADCPTVGTSLTTPVEIRADGATTRIEAERTLTLASDVLAVLDLCGVPRLPDAVIALRNRRTDGVTASLLVERIDCADGTSTVIHETATPPSAFRFSIPDAARDGHDRSERGDSTDAGDSGAGTGSEHHHDAVSTPWHDRGSDVSIPEAVSGAAVDAAVATADGIAVDIERPATGASSDDRGNAAVSRESESDAEANAEAASAAERDPEREPESDPVQRDGGSAGGNSSGPSDLAVTVRLDGAIDTADLRSRSVETIDLSAADDYD